jgi:chemotaxis protein MotB
MIARETMMKLHVKIAGLLLVVSAVTEMSAQSKAELFFRSKRYKASLVERDELCSHNKQLRRDSVAAAEELARQQKRFDSLSTVHHDLENTYKTLSSTSDKKLSELSATLDAKSRELRKKELSLQEKDLKLRELQSLLQRQDSILNYLNSTVKNALLGFKSDEFNVEMKNGKVYVSLSDKLLFKSGSASVEEKGKEAIKKLSEVLNKNSNIDIAIEGHTDNIPIKTSTYKDNWDLSVARATNIVRMICDEFAVDPKRVTTSGKGEYFPVANNDSAEGRAKNRRTEIVLSPKLEELFKILNSGK